MAVAAAAGVAGYFLVLRPWHRQWGTTKDESNGYLPGDELIPAGESVTHAITIDAPVEDVWPWLVQLGQDKAGFYSYTALENLVGCHMGHETTIHPEWQEMKVGDCVMFHPKAPPVPVTMIETNRHIVLGANLGHENETTWSFYLRPLSEGKTRFIVRLRGRTKAGIAKVGELFVLEPAHFVMEQKMMRTVKELAEARAKALRLPVGV
jgi:hypothetical protein